MLRHRRSLIALCITGLFLVPVVACGPSDTKPDAGSPVDAGIEANEGADAGSSASDAGQADAGQGADAGNTAPDAGTTPDAGSGPPCTAIDDIGPACEACVTSAEAQCSQPGGACESQYAAVVTCAGNAGCTTSPMDWQCAAGSCFASISQLDSCLYASCAPYQACFP